MRLLVASARGRLRAGTAPYAVLCNLAANNVPASTSNSDDYSFTNWYLRTDEASEIQEVWAHTPGVDDRVSSRIMRTSTPFAALSGFAHARFARDAILTAIRAWIGLLAGNWARAALTEELILADYVRAMPATAHARRYLFHNARVVVRPLWTYHAEQAGARVGVAFYSANCELYSGVRNEQSPFAFGYCGLTWSDYFVWDDWQADFLRRAGHGARTIRIANVVDFVDNGAAIGALDTPAIAVFDVVPYRPSVMADKGLVFPYNSGTIVADFLLRIADAAEAVGMTVVVKAKRQLGNEAAPEYIAAIEVLEQRRHVILLDPAVAARRVVRACQAVISFPFTSTALIGRWEALPSAYFDPTGQFETNNPLSHGIDVLSSESALRAWIARIATAPLHKTANA